MEVREFREPGRWKDGAGFTLPEVLITVLILGILFSIATSSWFGVVESRAVDSAANQLAADLRLSHARATNQLTDWAVVSNPASFATASGLTFTGGLPTGRDYYVIKVPGSGTAIPAVNVTGRDLGADDRAQIASSTPISLRFKPDGSVKAADGITSLSDPVTITVHKTAAGVTDPRHDIAINPATSRVKVD